MGVLEAHGWGSLGHECGRLLESMPKPTIAAVNGLRGRRRVRARARLRHPLRVGERQVRPARDQPGGHPRLGRDPAARAGGRRRAGEGPDPHRPHDRRGGGAPHRPRQRRLSARAAARAGARDGAGAREEEPGRALRGKGRGEPGAAGRPRHRPLVRGDPLLGAVRDRGPEGGHDRLLGEARAPVPGPLRPQATASTTPGGREGAVPGRLRLERRLRRQRQDDRRPPDERRRGRVCRPGRRPSSAVARHASASSACAARAA